MSTKVKTRCAECGTEMALPDDVALGELLDCENCGVELEVKSVEPPLLMVFEVEEK